MVWTYPLTLKQLATTVVFFVTGASLFGAGAYLSLVNIAPQQASAKARKDFLKDRLRKFLDD